MEEAALPDKQYEFHFIILFFSALHLPFKKNTTISHNLQLPYSPALEHRPAQVAKEKALPYKRQDGVIDRRVDGLLRPAVNGQSRLNHFLVLLLIRDLIREKEIMKMIFICNIFVNENMQLLQPLEKI